MVSQSKPDSPKAKRSIRSRGAGKAKARIDWPRILSTHLTHRTDWITIDPSSIALGWAKWAGWGMEQAGVLPLGWDAFMVRDLLRRFGPLEPSMMPRVVIIEDQYVGANPWSAKSVIRARVIAETVAQLAGWVPVTVSATSWQSGLLPGTPKKRENLKAASMGKAVEYLNAIGPVIYTDAAGTPITGMVHAEILPNGLTEDIADAMCIGLWARQMATAGRQYATISSSMLIQDG